ncbi:P-loop containing nucleoside triphosphate hydrolase protein [Radiomyces spectabilis]|uniref:P-loop containing nucleoside triphosphate hydrolase protein n=1 Tax=Radiomyces spectabilis TaxID=64574 RepID=UPI00221EC57F|nr:P-loop containing nucleoside triphosphate hydrolase protein [Radiomyces spectabilis]KAI8384738.1 P-loop containing nucleoside triphosphate hydrolase protein [Radiomyces spectabilis]
MNKGDGHFQRRKRHREYIPDERYDVSGRLVKNEAAIKKKLWNLKEILADPVKREKSLKEAQQFLKEQKQKKVADLDMDRPWSQEADDLFFSKRKQGLAAWVIPGRSPIYYEFETFFTKLKQSIQADDASSSRPTRSPMSIQREGELLRHALILFQDFQRRKTTSLKEKLEKNRAALPITPFANAIVQTLRQHRVLLIAGDTGCGKSTQVPQILLKAGFRKIACTQPRRIACSSLAKRVSYETLNEYGSEIAYQVRFEGTKTNRTRILFLTEGLLLRQYTSDDTLSMYDVIVVDEVHERHMMGDFLLALLKRLIKSRPNIYIVLMSATINAELFARYFDAPTLVVPGKMYHVKINYWPSRHEDKRLIDDAAYQRRQEAAVKESIPSKSERIDAGPFLKVLEYIDQSVPVTERGDLLIFMSGINEISDLAEELKQYANHNKKWIILMLHSSLSVDDQEKVFDMPPEGVRKCIISSNIAETSITIDGIRFIIDSGKVKELSHDAMSNMSKLSEFWISKASATQRTGRAGRTGPGECFRFYSENEFNHLNDFAVPEIQRAPLEPLLLQILAMNLGDPHQFDYIEAPSEDALNGSMDFLQNIGAVSAAGNITTLGSVLADLPVDAIIGKMLIMATIFNVIDPVITIAAGMSVQSPFTRIAPNSNPRILENRRTLYSHHGDPFTLLNLWQAWLTAKEDRKHSSRSWCRTHGVEEQRMYEIAKIRRQFEKVLNDFQPGLLESLKNKAEGSDDSEEEADRLKRQQTRELLRRERYGQRSSKKRRVLEFEYEGQEDWQMEREDKTDIRDLEFSLANNIKRLKSRTTELSARDIELVKLILCSALYPQLAVGDEHNPYRKSNEILFHTPVKNFLSLHPTSVLAACPNLVQGVGENMRKDDIDVEQAMYHQLLCYLQLLETTKPFMLNITRVPGIHVLLLFARHIDTNADCSVLIIDSYYMVKFRTVQVANYVLWLAHKLRSRWHDLLNRKLTRGTGQLAHEFSENEIISPSIRADLPPALQDILSYEEERAHTKAKHDMWTPAVEAAYQADVASLTRSLVDFMETAISAEFRMAKSSELLKLYPKYKAPPSEEQHLPRTWNAADVVRTGIQVTTTICYNALDAPSCAFSTPEQMEQLPAGVKMYWHCNNCDSTFSMTRNDILKHLSECGQ